MNIFTPNNPEGMIRELEDALWQPCTPKDLANWLGRVEHYFPPEEVPDLVLEAMRRYGDGTLHIPTKEQEEESRKTKEGREWLSHFPSRQDFTDDYYAKYGDFPAITKLERKLADQELTRYLENEGAYQ